ncbi:MAG: pyruvate, phosphate dikinase [Candidatus Omnitrophica bacterium]|nr:pyruvate, phosphate dikinase [Candidatus Omnitrophota bacterium]
MSRMVYFFGGGKADGKASMKNLLGGKGANLAEMAGHKDLKLPVPPGFTITTEVCTYYYKNKNKYPKALKEQVEKNLKKIEALMGRNFGDADNPLLVSVRSGARKSMPGMMETVLNVGLTERTLKGLIKITQNERFAYDSYRRLIMMYSDVVMEKAAGIESEEGMGVRKQLERLMSEAKKRKGVTNDTELDAQDLKKLCVKFKNKVKEVLNKDFPDDPYEQLWNAIGAVFSSWKGKRAVSYRRIENIPDEWGTAVNVQTMVFGNIGDDSATGVAFTRNPANGENKFYGEYLVNAQGEDVVAGIRTPAPLNAYSTNEQNGNLPTLEKSMPKLYRQLCGIRGGLEKHYHDMQDIEFTIEKDKLYMLQTRVGKRNGIAAVKMAVSMLKEKLIDKKVAVMRVTPEQLDELLHPIIDPKVELKTRPLAKGLPAGPGGATGQIVFSAEEAVEWSKDKKPVILLREETNPEDVEGMRVAQAILTARGGMTSHAALVARGWGKCCIVGCGSLLIDPVKKEVSIDGRTFKKGDWFSLNGTRGYVYEGQLPMLQSGQQNESLDALLKTCDSLRRLKIRTNADTPQDALRARQFGAEGIGLFRTEHMFYGKGSEEPLFKLRKMIVSKTVDERKTALDELYKHVKSDIKGTLEAMDGLPVTIRLIDPPLHEFVPHQASGMDSLARSLGISIEELEKRAANLRETNPMMGHRGVRLGITYPEVTEMQIRAVLESAAELIKSGKKVLPEIMIPVVCDKNELIKQKEIMDKVYSEVLKKYNIKKIPYLFGTMMEIPRATLLAGDIAQVAEFFSFGTNDLTQMGFGFSRDDIGGFLPEYLKENILFADPFQTIDQDGIGELIKFGIQRGRKTRKKLKIGICGEHGGEPKSIEFCHKVGMDYVSCSPFRVPIARLAAAQAALKDKK